jgi:hypothetical protein
LGLDHGYVLDALINPSAFRTFDTQYEGLVSIVYCVDYDLRIEGMNAHWRYDFMPDPRYMGIFSYAGQIGFELLDAVICCGFSKF